MDNMSKTAKMLDRLCAFVYWALIAAFVVIIFGCVFIGISLLRGAPLLKDYEAQLISFGNLEFLLAPGVLQECLKPGYGPWIIGLAVLVLGALVVAFLMLQTVRDVLQPFILRKPFHETVAQDLKRLSILLVIQTALNAVATVILDLMTRNFLDLNKLFLDGAIFGDRIITVGLANSTIDTTPLVFAAALFALSKVFLHGHELQTLSDETL